MRVLALAALFWMGVFDLALGLEVPFLAGRVQDDAGIMTSEAVARIETLLESLERETGAQLVILTLASLDGEPLADFSMRVAETWKLGQEGIDDGILLLISRDDRKIRLEVGYGLEGVMTDAASRRVIDQLIKPRFREGDFDRGIEQASAAIAGAIRGQEDAIPPTSPASGSGEVGGAWIFLGVFAVMIGPFVRVATRVRGAPGWIMFFGLLPFFFFIPLSLGLSVALIVTAIYVSSVGLVRIFLPERWRLNVEETYRGTSRKSRSRSRTWGHGGGWGGGGRIGGGGWGGGSSGGFSGGGGSFGGGGASGGW